MRIATWNVNSLRKRHERLSAWLTQTRPDVVCLQEIKMEEDKFPALDYLNLGYRAVVLGQKTYNGVAILSRVEHGAPEAIVAGLADGEEDPEARLIAATIPGLSLRVLSIYVPNGQTLSSDKYQYKLRWLMRLVNYLKVHCDPKEPLALCGDFNVAPEDRDVWDPVSWRDTVICHKEVRGAFSRLMSFGLVDSLRSHTAQDGVYTFWDYRAGAFPKNQGLRIDHILCTEVLAQSLQSAKVDRDARKGKEPSDHAPVVADFDVANTP